MVASPQYRKNDMELAIRIETQQISIRNNNATVELEYAILFKALFTAFAFIATFSWKGLWLIAQWIGKQYRRWQDKPEKLVEAERKAIALRQQLDDRAMEARRWCNRVNAADLVERFFTQSGKAIAHFDRIALQLVSTIAAAVANVAKQAKKRLATQ